MKIVNRKTFLQLPSGTIYSDYEPEIFNGLYVKTSEPGYSENDWVLIPLIDGFIKGHHETFKDIPLDYNHFEFDLDCSVRDGLYEEDQLFAIYEKEDILKLVARLTHSFLEADMN